MPKSPFAEISPKARDTHKTKQHHNRVSKSNKQQTTGKMESTMNAAPHRRFVSLVALFAAVALTTLFVVSVETMADHDGTHHLSAISHAVTKAASHIPAPPHRIRARTDSRHRRLNEVVGPATSVLRLKDVGSDIPDYKQFNFLKTTESAPSCEATLNPDDVDFTIVMQFSMNRVNVMKHHCARWSGHRMSLGIGTNRSKTEIAEDLQTLGCNTDLIDVVTVPYEPPTPDSVGSPYPVNELRNAAIANVKTSHLVLLDVDFVLSKNAYESFAEQRSILVNEKKTALLIPAFELRSFCRECQEIHDKLLPGTKQELLELYDGETDPNGTVITEPTVSQFDVKGNVGGHGSTRYKDWMQQDEHTVLPIKCLTSDRFEPYLIVRYCSDLPPFQSVFTGYGQNKKTWFQQLRRSGYQMLQLGGAFVVHFPHPKSAFFKKWEKQMRKADRRLDMEINQIASSFHVWMGEHVPDETRLPWCPNAERIDS